MADGRAPAPGDAAEADPSGRATAGRRARFAVVGAGIIGLAVARGLAQRWPDAELTVFEKEPAVGLHQTGRNSGVVHAGIYYEPTSRKAELCVRGGRMLRRYCDERSIPFHECGKLVIAVDGSEVAGLRTLYERGLANGVPGLRWLDQDGIREIEPHAVGVAAIHSPHTAVVDYGVVARQLAADLQLTGAEVLLGAEVTALRQVGEEVRLEAAGHGHAFDTVIVCAGLHADRLAQLSGDDEDPFIVPFRGEYLRLTGASAGRVKALIYPVPDPRYPFLGVHLTRHIDDTVTIGPNAVLAFAREGYGYSTVVPRDLLETLRWPGFRRMAAEHWRIGAREMAASFRRRRFLAAARRYVPSLDDRDVVRAPSGVRAQAVDRTGRLVDDFTITQEGRIVHVRNAPSPAATASLAIADHIVETVLVSGARQRG